MEVVATAEAIGRAKLQSDHHEQTHLTAMKIMYWHQRAERGLATLPKDNQEPLVMKDKAGRSPCELNVSKSVSKSVILFSLQCFDTVVWVTGRASLL